MTIVSAGTMIDWKINSFGFGLSSLFTTTVWYNACITANVAPTCLLITSYILPSLLNKIPRYLTQNQPPNLKGDSRCFWAEHCDFKLRGADSYTNHFALGGRSAVQWRIKNYIISKSADAILMSPNWMLSRSIKRFYKDNKQNWL